MTLPAWLAVIEPVPVVSRVTAVPDTVQTEVLFDANATVSPEVEVALSAGGVEPSAWVLNGPNVIVCETGLTVKLWVPLV